MEEPIFLNKKILEEIETNTEYIYLGNSWKDRVLKKIIFLILTNYDWRNATYIKKNGEKFGNPQYFDLLFVLDKNNHPICLPVPIVKELFGLTELNPNECKDIIKGTTYEAIYQKFYDERKKWTDEY